MIQSTYEQNEVRRFRTEQNCFYDSINEFDQMIKSRGSEWVLQQLEWIENGSYGAGACLVLRNTWEHIKDNKRVNKLAWIGQVLLKCLYGKDFKMWNKLTIASQNILNDSISKWIESEKDFAI